MATIQRPSPPPTTEEKVLRIALVGNPNTGKTTLFNTLTGLNQKVGNYPGVTVERKVGRLRRVDEAGEKLFEFIDLPGTYSLSANSPDEMIVTDVLLNQQPGENPIDLIVAVVDAGNITRNLYYVSQLLELRRPIILALNMCDLAEGKNIKIDAEGLSKRLGVPVIPMCASKRSGVDQLIAALDRAAKDGGVPSQTPQFPQSFNRALEHVKTWIDEQPARAGREIARPELFRALVDENGYAERRLSEIFGVEFSNQIQSTRSQIYSSEPLSAVEAVTRYKWIGGILDGIVAKPKQPVQTKSDKIDQILTHKVYGLAIFVTIMAVVFQAIYSWAGPIMDAIDGFFAASGALLSTYLPPGPLHSLIVDGIIGGVGFVLVFLPQIAILFLFLGILDDCGYMPRAAFMMDRLLSKCGLSGKSFIPLLSSFACAVPGIMATRTIESKKERFITILVAPLMSCSARLPVYLVLIGAFVPSQTVLGAFNLQALTLLGFYMLGALVAVPMALVFKKFMKGQSTPFVLEFPSFKWPTPRTVSLYVYEQSREFIVRAGTVIFCFTVIIWALSYFPRPASIGERFETQRAQLAQQTYNQLQPLLAQADAENVPQSGEPQSALEALMEHPQFNPSGEPAADGSAKQRISAVIENYQQQLSQINNQENGEYVRASFLGQAGRVIEPVVQPLGWDWRIGMAALASFPAREVVLASLGTILNVGSDIGVESNSLRTALTETKRPSGEPLFNLAVALSIMVFFALCAQCVSTLAVIYRETRSVVYPLLTFSYMTFLAYIGALITYQTAQAIGLG